MKCTNRKRRRNRKRELTIRLICSGLFIIGFIIGLIYLLNAHGFVSKYDSLAYGTHIYQSSLFADDLCVEADEVPFEAFHTNDEFHGALLFNLAENKTIFSQHPTKKLYPASTTKIMTAYLALKYGDLSSYITVSAKAVDVPSDSSKAHLQKGDVLSLEDLLYGLMLPSGNDSAVAIAEHISGSTDEFVKLMNEEAKLLGATNTHFMNPHGYHHKNHYTTAYDLYLIFNKCIQNETFLKIVSSRSYSTRITQANGNVRDVTWGQSNQFINGQRKVPNGITLVGGKTGNTFDAGSCILLYGHDSKNVPYIAIMMGASSRRNLYDNMTFLLAAIE